MANTSLYLDGIIKWGTSWANSHQLRVPLQQVRPGHRKRRYVREPLDYSSRDVTSIGSGVYEIVALIRFDTDPDGLLSLLIAGLDGETLRYYPDETGDSGTYWDVVMVEPTVTFENSDDEAVTRLTPVAPWSWTNVSQLAALVPESLLNEKSSKCASRVVGMVTLAPSYVDWKLATVDRPKLTGWVSTRAPEKR